MKKQIRKTWKDEVYRDVIKQLIKDHDREIAMEQLRGSGWRLPHNEEEVRRVIDFFNSLPVYKMP